MTVNFFANAINSNFLTSRVSRGFLFPAPGLAVPSVFITRSTNMATKVDIAGTDITASQMSEFYRLAALPGGHVNRGTFQAYLERRNPFAFERNEHGHVVLTFTGLDITGAEEIARLKAASYRVNNYAESCFLSTKDDGYDKHHRLEAGRIYKVAFMPGKEIERDGDRTTENLRKRGMQLYGYGK